MTVKRSIFICAGDPSADFPGKSLITALKKRCPDIEVFGLGGPQMQKAGLDAIADHRDLAVLGFWEIIPKILYFRKLMKKAAGLIAKKQPAAVILIDYPGFNLRLAKRITSLKIPVIYYISPQVWAWGKSRVAKIRKLIDKMLVIFPFEVGFYKQHEIDAVFAGHPIIDRFREVPAKSQCRDELRLAENDKVVALLPGSRLQEVKRMLPEMIGAAQKMQAQNKLYKFIVAATSDIDKNVYDKIIGDAGIEIISGKTPEIINASDLVLTSSGTATIETAYFAKPMVVIYKTGLMTYWIARRLIKLDCIAMANIVAGKKVVPELIQHEAHANNIARVALEILNNSEQYHVMEKELATVRAMLGESGAGEQACNIIMKEFPLC